MKNRDYKIFVPNRYYHIFNRGNGKQNIFFDEADYEFFLHRLKQNLFPEKSSALSLEGRPLGRTHSPYIRKTLPAGAFTVLSYCLMPNHFHFLMRQNTELPISKLIAKVCTSYGMYFNKRYEKVGNLLQSKFRSILVDTDSYLLWLSAYIHQNPKVAGLVNNLSEYQWSSYLDYIAKRNGDLCDKNLILSQFGNVDGYQKFVEESFDKIKERKDLSYLLLD